MNKISDETIMAYVDGQLDREEAARIGRALEDDPDLKKKARLFQETTDMLHDAYHPLLEERVPEHLVNTVCDHEPKDWRNRIAGFFASLPPLFPARPALAAVLGILLFVALGLVSYRAIHPLRDGDLAARLAANAAFNHGLETTPSGRSVVLDRLQAQLVPLRTFQDRELRFCRQFELISNQASGETVSEGIACRNGGGRWSLLTLLVPSQEKENALSNTFELAGNKTAVDELFETMRAGPPLDREQEARLIDSAWTVSQ